MTVMGNAQAVIFHTQRVRWHGHNKKRHIERAGKSQFFLIGGPLQKNKTMQNTRDSVK